MHKRFGLIILILGLLLTRLTPAFAGAAPPVPARIQVLVVGGTPAGIAAAIAASRTGMKTLLLEPREAVGGDITEAWLNVLDMNWGPHGKHLTRGIFLELYRWLGQTFDIARARTVLDGLLKAQPNLTVMVNTRVLAPLMQGSMLTGVLASDDRTRLVFPILADEIIDATDNASIADASGVPYTIGREDSGLDHRMQAATLIFRLAGVNYEEVAQYVSTVEKPRLRGGVHDRYIWGYADIARTYKPTNHRLALLDLNLGWQSDGMVLVNALQIFDVDGTDPRSVREDRTLALAELPSVVSFLRSAAPGFEQATLVDAAPHLYIRETRHIVGLYRMTGDDIVKQRDFWDRIALASYPIDLHPYVPGGLNPLGAARHVYAIPFRILVPRGVDRLMVVGKAVSATYTAAGSLRIIPTAIAMGEAAGEAAALMVTTGTTPQVMALDRSLIAQLQSRLTSVGVLLASPQSLYTQATRVTKSTPISTQPSRTIPRLNRKTH